MANIWDKQAESYSKQPVKDVAGWEDTLTRIRKHLSSTSKVLEVGCGTGSSALKLAASCNSILGTDYSPNMIEIARAKTTTAGVTNATFQVAEAETIADTATKYDVAVALNVLHLCKDPPKVLNTLHAQLKPGGVIATKSHLLAGKWPLKLLLPVAQFFGKAPHVEFFNDKQLTEMHKAAGFDIIDSVTYDKGERKLIIGRKLENDD